MTKCTICGRQVPISEIEQHIKIEMLDPKYREIQKEVQERAKNVTMAQGNEIHSHLQDLKRRRPDIFGAEGDESFEDRGPYKKANDGHDNQYTNNNDSIMEQGVQLIPVRQWLQKNPGILMLKIRIPDMSDEHSSLKGQTAQIQVDPSTTIWNLKGIIKDYLQGIDEQRQRLSSSLFKPLKDDKSLA